MFWHGLVTSAVTFDVTSFGGSAKNPLEKELHLPGNVMPMAAECRIQVQGCGSSW
jgi:hypothetical protein